MKEEKIRVLALLPTEYAKTVIIDNTLEAMQQFVGGLIECLPIIGCTHDRVSMSDLSTLTAVGNKVDTKIQNCVWDVRRFILLTNLVID